ncbi:MAG: FliH/SctL family protein [Clostridiales bacterium]|nr:FliH/SctL family protein [Clostridiales bacterium]
MSNLIKGGRIYYNDSEKVVIDSDSRPDSFRPLSFTRVEEKEEDFSDTPDMEEEQTSEKVQEENPADDMMWENMVREKEALLAEARTQAELILNQAREEADVLKEEARQQGKSEGYEEGLAVAQAENEEAKAAIRKEQEELRTQYEQMVSELEPTIAEIIASLLEKLTGVLSDTTEDIVVHLIHQGLCPYTNKKSFLVHVGPKDYVHVVQKQEQIRKELPEDAQVHILEDDTLKEKQCILEIGDMLIDCSLDVQLNNLIRDLKMLSMEP